MDVLARSLFAGTLYGVGVTFFAAIQADDLGPVVVVATITLFTSTISIVGYFFRLQIKRTTEKEIEKS
jgi:hypothetical protein